MPRRSNSSGVSVEILDGAITVRVKRAELVDPGFIAGVQIEALHAIEAADEPRVLLDLSPVRLASSAAVGLTLALHRAVDERRGQLAVIVHDPGVLAVFERCRVDALFEIHQNAESALQALARQD